MPERSTRVEVLRGLERIRSSVLFKAHERCDYVYMYLRRSERTAKRGKERKKEGGGRETENKNSGERRTQRPRESNNNE